MLREFGLIGGDVTQNVNSGTLINCVMHPRIDLSWSLTLTRTVVLTFAGGGAYEHVGEFGTSLPAVSIAAWVWASEDTA